MRTCPVCGRAVGDGVNFCPGCGSKMPQRHVCPVCGRENRAGAAFCSACGAAMQGESTAPQSQPVEQTAGQPLGQTLGQTPGQATSQAPTQAPGVTPGQASGGASGGAREPIKPEQPLPEQMPPVPPADAVGQPESKKKGKMTRGKKAALCSGVGVVVLGLLAALAFFVILPMMQQEGIDPVSLYAKDGEIYYVNDSGEEVAVTRQLFLDDSIDSQLMTSDWWAVGYYLALSDDGARIFYPDQIAGDASNIPLYTRLVSEPADKAVLVDSDVAQYQITPDGKKVTYINGEDYALYQSDLANRTMIAEDVRSFIGSEDGQTVLYLDKNGAVFRWTAGGGILRVTDDAGLSKGFAQKKMAVYYVKDGTLYEYTVNSETPKQIATGVQDVVWITGDGQVYYTASADGGMTMMDFVEDDIAQSGTVTMPEEPEEPKKPSRDDYKDGKAYEKAMKQYEKDWDAYDKAMGRWEQDMSDYYDRQEAAEEADSTRYELENTSAKDFIADLYYYDGNTTSLVAEKVAVNNWRGTYSLMSSIWNSYPDEPMGFVTQWDPSAMEKIPLSDVIEESKEQSCSASWVMESKLRDAKNSGLLGIVVGNTCTFSAEGVKSVTFARDGSVAYTFFYDEETSGEGFALYRTPIQNGKPGEQETIQTGAVPVAVLKDGRLVCGKYGIDGLTLDIYMDGVKIDTIDAYYDAGEGIQGTNGESLAYFSTWDSETESGTLRVWENGGATTVASGVRSFQMREDGSVLYLYNFDETTGTGTLGLYQNGTMTVLNHDTNCLIPTTDRVLYGDY